MLQAKIYGMREHLVPIRDASSKAANESISVGLGLPRERRLQRFSRWNATRSLAGDRAFERNPALSAATLIRSRADA